MTAALTPLPDLDALPAEPFCSECAYIETPDLPRAHRRALIPLVDATGSWSTCVPCAVRLVVDAVAGGARFTIMFDDARTGVWP